MILVDTGPLVAAVHRQDDRHGECRELVNAHAGQLLIRPYVVAEVCWLVSSRLGAAAEANIVEAVAAGEFRQVDVTVSDLDRIAELLHQYHDLHGGQGLSVADASIVAAAERLGLHEIATLDATDFTLVRPRHVDHFTLLP